MYADVMDRLEELIDAHSIVYPAGPFQWDRLAARCHVGFTANIREATWLVSELRNCPMCVQRIQDFSASPGIADFAFVGGVVSKLPSTLEITASESHGNVVLTYGKRINL